MMSLFASFDMNIFWFNSLFVGMLTFCIISNKMFISSSFNNFLKLNLLKKMIFMFRKTKKNIPDFYVNYLSSLFIFIFLLNFLSVGPYVFPLTSQMSLILILSLFSWLPTIIFFMLKNWKGFLYHLVPESSPMVLVPMLVIIEFVSNIIRPLTLTVRLVANIVAGHILMELYSSLSWKSLILFSGYSILSLIEMLVATIQAYVFMMMSLLYLAELE